MGFKKFIIYESILYKACENGNIELVKYIISLKKINVNQKNIFNNFMFFIIFSKFFKLMKLKYYLYSWYSQKLFIYKTILFRTCELNNIELVKYLTSLKKVDINTEDILICFINNISSLKKFIIFKITIFFNNIYKDYFL